MLIISVAVPGPLTIQQLREKYNVTIEQLNSEIEEKDIPYLAENFDRIEYYFHAFDELD